MPVNRSWLDKACTVDRIAHSLARWRGNVATEHAPRRMSTIGLQASIAKPSKATRIVGGVSDEMAASKGGDAAESEIDPGCSSVNIVLKVKSGAPLLCSGHARAPPSRNLAAVVACDESTTSQRHARRLRAVQPSKLHSKGYSTPLTKALSVYGPVVEDVWLPETLAAVAPASFLRNFETTFQRRRIYSF